MDGHCILLGGNKHDQVLANQRYLSKIYLMDSKRKAGNALHTFCKEFDIPYNLTFGGSREQCGKNTTFMDEIRKHSINYYISEANLHNQKEVEGVIREIGNNWFKTMIRKTDSRQLWDYRIIWCSEIMSLTNLKEGVSWFSNFFRRYNK